MPSSAARDRLNAAEQRIQQLAALVTRLIEAHEQTIVMLRDFVGLRPPTHRNLKLVRDDDDA